MAIRALQIISGITFQWITFQFCICNFVVHNPLLIYLFAIVTIRVFSNTIIIIAVVVISKFTESH